MGCNAYSVYSAISVVCVARKKEEGVGGDNGYNLSKQD